MRPLLRLATVIAGLLLLTTLPAAPAGAIGGETFGCRLSPGTVLTYKQTCLNSRPASSYTVAFAVQNTSGTYTFSWSITGDWTSVVTGCGSADAYCTVRTNGSTYDHSVHGQVTFSQAGQSVTRQSSAFIRIYCGSVPC
ncbi:MAG TPA: hypothetical protein VE547_08600 [Mycobacteriales bacterium]|nr:hypothetical protein [Mycobacteriales bacterium]